MGNTVNTNLKDVTSPTVGVVVKDLFSSEESKQKKAAERLADWACQNHATYIMLIGESRDIVPGLVQLLGRSNIDVQEPAVRALSYLVSRPCFGAIKQKMAECEGAIPGLVQLLTSSSEAIQKHAAAALGNLAYHNDLNKKLIGECEGAIPGLVQPLTSSSEAIQQHAVATLRNLAYQNDLNKKLIGECEGAIPGLVQLLTSSSETIQESAAEALINLAYHNDLNKKLIGECKGAIQGLVQLLGSSSALIQRHAVIALKTLAEACIPNQQLMGKCEGAIPGLVQLLRSSRVLLRGNAAAALAELARACPCNQQLIVFCGAIPDLVQLLGNKVGRVQFQAAQCLEVLSEQLQSNRKLIAECKGAIPGLVQLLGSSYQSRDTSTADQSTSEKAATVLGNLGIASLPYQKLIGEYDGAIPGLVRLLGSTSERLQSAAATTLRNLAASCPPNQKLIHKAINTVHNDGIPILVQHLVEDISSAGGQTEAFSPTIKESVCCQNLTGANVTPDAPAVTRSSLPTAKPIATPHTDNPTSVVIVAGSNTGPSAQPATGMGVAALRAAANLGQVIPMCGPLIAGALNIAASVLSMVQQVGLNKAKASILADRAQLIRGVLQDLQTKAVSGRVKIPKTEEEQILMALQQLQTAFDAARRLLSRWIVFDKRNIWQAIQRFGATQQDNNDLIEVDQHLCTSYNQLVNVLSTCSLFHLQLSASRAEAAMTACQQDIAGFEQNLITIAGSVDQVQQELQHHSQEMRQVWPMLQAQGVQLKQLDTIFNVILVCDSKLDEVLSYLRPQQQDKVLSPKPDMLILPNDIKLLGRSLGEGASAAVYPAKFGREEVAVKCFFLQGATRQQLTEVYKEAILLSRLQHHPNIIRCYGMIASPQHNDGNNKDPCQVDSTHLPDLHGSLVMEKCDLDLHKLLGDDRVQLNLLDKAYIALDVASGMRYLHHGCGSLAPVVHGDLKPSNILVNLGNDNKPRQVKVCDFGISHTCQISSTLYLTTTGKYRSFGSPQWLAPEACEALLSIKKGQKQPSTTAVDVYAFGILLFEVVSGQQPFATEDALRLPYKVFNGLRPLARDWLESQHTESVPETGGEGTGDVEVLQQLVTLMEACWAADPAERPSFINIVGRLETIVKQLESQ